MIFKVNKEKCIGCGICVANCPKAIEMGQDDKAKIVDQKKMEECGGENVCPIGAIEEKESK